MLHNCQRSVQYEYCTSLGKIIGWASLGIWATASPLLTLGWMLAIGCHEIRETRESDADSCSPKEPPSTLLSISAEPHWLPGKPFARSTCARMGTQGLAVPPSFTANKVY